MARLGQPVQIPEFEGDLMERWAAEDRWFEDFRKQNDVVGFPVADGGAFYKVSPGRGTLYHVPIGDAYQIPYAYVRGLTKADLNRLLEPSPFGAL